MSRRLVPGLAAGALLAWVACSGVDFTAPSGTTMTISANPTTIVLDGGSTNITVSLIEGNGIPVANKTVVRFTTTLGAIDPVTETKDGLAQVTLTSTGVAGPAEVTAISGSNQVTITITIGVTPSNISLVATPASLTTGGGTVQLAATVFGDNSSPVAGASVAFSTTAGSLGSSGDPVTTNGQGVARDTLTTTRTAEVTVTSGSNTQTITVPVGATGNINLILSADRVSLPTGGGTVSLVAVVLGDSGPVPDVALAWSASAGSLANPGTTLTNADGEATNTLSTAVNATVTVAAVGETQTLDITVGSTVTPVIAISSERASIPLLNAQGGPFDTCMDGQISPLPIEISAQVQDQDGNDLAGREVTFFMEFGSQVLDPCGRVYGQFCDTGGNTVTATTDSRGIASVSFTMTETDIEFCNCLPPAGVCDAPASGDPGYCPNMCAAQCTTSSGVSDLFCQVAISAVSGGIFSDNIQYIEYGR